MTPPTGVSAFAIAAPGLERLVAAELVSLGIAAEPQPGGAAFTGSVLDVARANLWSRIASRIVVRLGDFHVRALGELARRSARLPWDEHLKPGTEVHIRASARKSRLYHTGAIAERVLEGLAKRVAVLVAAGGDDADDDDDRDAAQLIIVRLDHDHCTISVDSSGALLHRRGYRQATAKAPLRETLAAAMLTAGGWDPSSPLADPFCGSGTIAIEAALMSRGIAPGLERSFAFERWPGHEPKAWAALREEARSRIWPATTAPIYASDRDAGAIAAAEANAERAGVRNDIVLTRAALSAAPLGESGGWIVTNPPYGVRVGDKKELRDLYATLGRIVRTNAFRLVMLSADAALERQLGVEVERVLATRNGGLAVRVLRSSLFQRSS